MLRDYRECPDMTRLWLRSFLTNGESNGKEEINDNASWGHIVV